MRLIQFVGPEGSRAIGVVDDSVVRQVNGVNSIRELALKAITEGRSIEDEVQQIGLGASHDYDQLISDGRVLPPIDHPDAAHVMVAGTGLTHIDSASSRSKMHEKASSGDEAHMTDTERMFKWGLDGGKPASGTAGVQPEWFYKGDGSIVVSPGAPLDVPDFSDDVGEEPEIVGLYVIGDENRPYRVGFAIGNEVTDHVMEKKNYLYLAHSKLRQCAFGPELFVGTLPDNIEGTARILRDGQPIWEKSFPTGEANMSHSIENIEFHHFKYNQLLRVGDVHAVFMGTSVASFGDGVEVKIGDTFEIAIPLFGRPLVNTTRTSHTRVKPGAIKSL
ncbi:AraD1 family protein [Brucella sp. BE17]|uniref:AraD1 family protein n=1 Tax=Brucella sp. BE17 TaxID=3142977 RepID=UPI0031BA5C68